MFDYAGMQKIASGLIGQFAQGVMNYVQIVPGDGPAHDPGPPTENVYPIKGTATGVEAQYIRSGYAQTGDLQVVMAVRSDMTPALGDRLEADSVPYNVVKVLPKPAVGTPVALCVDHSSIGCEMARPKSLERQIQELVDKFVPEIREAVLASIQDIKDRATLQALIDAIKLGDLEAAFRAIGYSDAAMRPISATIERAFEAGGVVTAASFPKLLKTPTGDVVFRFDPRNSRAEQYLRDKSSDLVTRTSAEIKVGLRDLMQEGMVAGRNPRSVALDIIGTVNPTTGRREGGIVGLSEPQTKYVVNARRELKELNPAYFNRERRDKRFDRTVQKAIDSGTPLSNAQIEKLINRYSDSLLQLRGETIARTEALAALNRAEHEATLQAAEIGAINRKATKREWDSAGDARVRKDHQEMDGQQVGIDEPFVAPDGSRLMHPGDTSLGASAKQVIDCRCRVRLVIDWFDGVD